MMKHPSHADTDAPAGGPAVRAMLAFAFALRASCVSGCKSGGPHTLSLIFAFNAAHPSHDIGLVPRLDDVVREHEGYAAVT